MEDIFQTIFRTTVLYGVIILIFRMMGKREIGELSIIDIVVSIMMAELAVIAIEKPEIPFVHALIPMFVLMMVQILTAYISLKSKRFRNLVEGRPVLIIKNGKIDEEAMRKQRYTFDDLMLQLRQKNILDLADVEFALLENSGKLSVVTKEKNKDSLMVPLIMDGKVQKQHLQELGKTEQWLKERLRKLGYEKLEEISLCIWQNGKFFVDLKNKKKF